MTRNSRLPEGRHYVTLICKQSHSRDFQHQRSRAADSRGDAAKALGLHGWHREEARFSGHNYWRCAGSCARPSATSSGYATLESNSVLKGEFIKMAERKRRGVRMARGIWRLQRECLTN